MINIYKPFYSIHQILVTYIIFLFLLSACTGRTSNHGVLNIDNNIQNILQNNMEKAEVEILLGPPSTISTFDKNKWYYMSNIIHRAGVSKPKILKHQIYEIIFDEENRVIVVLQFDFSNFKEIDYNDKETATKGNEQNLFEMIVRSSSKLPN